jgi:hypothetical protein
MDVYFSLRYDMWLMDWTRLTFRAGHQRQLSYSIMRALPSYHIVGWVHVRGYSKQFRWAEQLARQLGLVLEHMYIQSTYGTFDGRTGATVANAACFLAHDIIGMVPRYVFQYWSMIHIPVAQYD